MVECRKKYEGIYDPNMFPYGPIGPRAVAEDLSGANVSGGDHQNRNEGYITHGSYDVALPDGRIKTVTYDLNADGHYYVSYQSFKKHWDYFYQNGQNSQKPVPKQPKNQRNAVTLPITGKPSVNDSVKNPFSRNGKNSQNKRPQNKYYGIPTGQPSYLSQVGCVNYLGARVPC